MCIATMFVQALLLAIAATVPLAHAQEEYRCWQPVVPGNCYPPAYRYAYYASTKSCQRFRSGCGRNVNNFYSKKHCEDTCVKKGACSQPVVPGYPCTDLSYRYAYFPNSNSCEVFGYNGCGGNDNNFRTLGECKNKCL